MVSPPAYLDSPPVLFCTGVRGVLDRKNYQSREVNKKQTYIFIYCTVKRLYEALLSVVHPITVQISYP